MHASGVVVLGLLILHTSLVKLNIKMRREDERARERMKGEEPCLILWDVRVSAVYGDRDVGMCSVLHGSENIPN